MALDKTVTFLFCIIIGCYSPSGLAWTGNSFGTRVAESSIQSLSRLNIVEDNPYHVTKLNTHRTDESTSEVAYSEDNDMNNARQIIDLVYDELFYAIKITTDDLLHISHQEEGGNLDIARNRTLFQSFLETFENVQVEAKISVELFARRPFFQKVSMSSDKKQESEITDSSNKLGVLKVDHEFSKTHNNTQSDDFLFWKKDNELVKNIRYLEHALDPLEINAEEKLSNNQLVVDAITKFEQETMNKESLSHVMFEFIDSVNKTIRQSSRTFSLWKENKRKKDLDFMINTNKQQAKLLSDDTILTESSPKRKIAITDTNIWKEAGYIWDTKVESEHTISLHALESIQSLSLKAYKLANDTKKDLLINKGAVSKEMRSRYHVGVILDENKNNSSKQIPMFSEEYINNNSFNDYRQLFFYNIEAIQNVLKVLDEIETKIEILEEFLFDDMINVTFSKSYSNGEYYKNSSKILLEKIVNTYTKLMKHTNETDDANNNTFLFESNNKLAAKIVALETEASKAEIDALIEEIKHSTQLYTLNQTFEKQLRQMEYQINSFSFLHEFEQDILSRNDDQATDAENIFESTIALIQMIYDVGSLGNETARKLETIDAASKIEVDIAKAEIFEKAKEERQNESISLERIRVLGEEAKKEFIQLIETIVYHINTGLDHIIHTKDGKRQMLAMSIAVSMLTFCIYAAKEGVNLLFSILQNILSRPRLIREYGSNAKYRWLGFFFIKNENYIMNIKQLGIKSHMDKVTLSTDNKERLLNIIRSSCRGGMGLRHGHGFHWMTKTRIKPEFHGYHLLLYGPPGTGKTLTAKCIAQALSPWFPYYIVISGADVLPLGQNGPNELRKVLSWANNRSISSRSSGGVIIIIDEAESALGTRAKNVDQKHSGNVNKDDNNSSGSTIFSTDILNVFLSMTGNDHCGNFMLILTTCYPESLDAAVLDRMDEMVNLSFPSSTERLRILRNKFTDEFDTDTENTRSKNCWEGNSKRQPKKIAVENSFEWEKALANLSRDRNTLGLSGRELCQIIRGVKSEIYGSSTSGDNNSNKLCLTEDLWNQITHGMCQRIVRKKHLTSYT